MVHHDWTEEETEYLKVIKEKNITTVLDENFVVQVIEIEM